MRIVIIVPCYNESASIGKVLDSLEAYRDSVIVVNDGSTDNTAEIVGTRAKLINLPVNLGIGKAVQAGFRYALELGADVVVTFDGDGQHPAGAILGMIKTLGWWDVVIGSRYVCGRRNISSLAREAGTRWFSLVVRVVSGGDIFDTTSGFRAYNRAASEWVAQHYPDDYPEVESLITLCRRFRVVEYPVQMLRREGGKSSINWYRSVYYMCKVSFSCLLARTRA